MKITKSAQKSLDTGIADTIIRRSRGGQICQSGFVRCNNHAILQVGIDNSLPLQKRITSAKLFYGNWYAACQQAVNS